MPQEELAVCPYCHFKCVTSQLYKSEGKCPSAKCGKIINKKIYDEVGALKTLNQ